MRCDTGTTAPVQLPKLRTTPALPAGVGTTPETGYSYDAGGVSNSKGRLTSVTSNVSSYSYSGYDAMGRVLGGTQTTGEAYPMSYSYDLAGNMTSQTYPSGRIVASEFDAAGRLAGVVKNQASGLYYVGADNGQHKPHSIQPAWSNESHAFGQWVVGARQF